MKEGNVFGSGRSEQWLDEFAATQTNAEHALLSQTLGIKVSTVVFAILEYLMRQDSSCHFERSHTAGG
jgi:hypothetical protein